MTTLMTASREIAKSNGALPQPKYRELHYRHIGLHDNRVTDIFDLTFDEPIR